MGPTGQALVRCWCSMFKRGTNSRRSWYRWWAILSWGKAGKKSVFTGLLGSWVCFSWWPFPKSTYSVLLECSWTISQDSSSGLCWSILTSVCPFTLVPFSLSFLSHVLFLPSTLPPSFAHLQQIDHYTNVLALVGHWSMVGGRGRFQKICHTPDVGKALDFASSPPYSKSLWILNNDPLLQRDPSFSVQLHTSLRSFFFSLSLPSFLAGSSMLKCLKMFYSLFLFPMI